MAQPRPFRLRLNILTEPAANPKTAKNAAMGYLTAGLHLAPANESGLVNMCTSHTPGCAHACLYHSGRAAFSSPVKPARVERTRLYVQEPRLFWAMLELDIMLLNATAAKHGLHAAVRLNVTSDIKWENLTHHPVITDNPDVEFYDYTKHPGRVTPSNYHLTFSRSELNHRVCMRELEAGRNVAVVFTGPLPRTWEGYPVINGDLHDCRFLDPPNVVIGLSAKGKRAKADTSGFVVHAT